MPGKAMFGKAVLFVTMCTLSFAILGEAGRVGDAAGSKGTAVDAGKASGVENAPGPKGAAGQRAKVEGVPFDLLPCEMGLAVTLQVLAEAKTPREIDAAILETLRLHPFVEEKGAPGGAGKLDLGKDVGVCTEGHFRLNIRAFNQWLKTGEGRAFAREAGGPSDDGLYTVSPVLRTCMPRGLSHFTFSEAPEEHVVVRGFRKFTGLTAEDEDEESGATNATEDFYYTKELQPARFSITTKSNGENGKLSFRSIANKGLLFAGSKNTCVVWPADQDVSTIHPLVKGAPGPSIAAWAQRFWRGWEADARSSFAERVGSAGWTLMLEHNDAHHEHIFPIMEDFVEFVAILDCTGLPLPQKQAFAFFDEFHLPRVRCEEGLPMLALSERLVAEREAVDREGVVLYLETEAGEAVGLLKVKSDFYVRARRTRQIFWNTLVDPLLRGDSLDSLDVPARKVGGRRTGGVGWDAAEKRMRSGMRELKHVEGCAEHSRAWGEIAAGFVHWWHAKFDATAASPSERKRLLREAKDKFGSTYRDYCRDADLPGGSN